MKSSNLDAESDGTFGRWVKRMILLAALGAAYQAVGEALDRRRLSPPGRLIDLDGYRLHVSEAGEGVPTVVFDCGLGASSLNYALVAPEIAKITKTVLYDRAGLGWSETGPKPRTSGQIVRELHLLLIRAGLIPPFVLVGHSFGGLNVRLFAGTYPHEVAGLVLVDVSHEEQTARFAQIDAPPMMRVMMRASPLIFRAAAIVALLGITRILLKFGRLPSGSIARITKNLSPDDLEQTLVSYSQTKSWITSADEYASFEDSANQVRDARTRLPVPDVPMVVISAGNRGPKSEGLSRVLDELHGDLLGLTSKSTRVVAEKSGHIVTHDEPAVVIAAIRQVIDQVRTEQASQGAETS